VGFTELVGTQTAAFMPKFHFNPNDTKFSSNASAKNVKKKQLQGV
jgi:hypothetical protein